MKKLLIFLSISLILLNGCASTFEAETQKSREFHEEHKGEEDFVGFYKEARRNYKYEEDDYLSHEFVYNVNVKNQGRSVTSLGQIGANEAYKSQWYIHLCITDKDGENHYYKGRGHRDNSIPLDMKFPFDSRALVTYYYSKEGWEFINFNAMSSNCRDYIITLSKTNDPNFYFDNFSIDPINDYFIEKFKKKEGLDCSNLAWYKHNYPERYEIFLSKEPLKYSGITCCESFAQDNPESSQVMDCRNAGVI